MPSRLGSLLRGWNAGVEKNFAATAERLRRQGQPARAVELCRTGLTKFPDQLSARVTLGCALMDLEEYDEARVELEYVLTRAPDNLAAIRGLAELHDRSESTAVMQMEHLDDWPPRSEDIERAGAETPVVESALGTRHVPDLHADTPLAPEPAPAPAEPGGVSVAAMTGGDEMPAATAELLDEADALDAMAERAEASSEPVATVDLDSEAVEDLDDIATELSDPADASGAPGLPPGADAGADGAGEAASQEGAPIVLDADLARVDLDELVDLEFEAPGSADPVGEDRSGQPTAADERSGGPRGGAADTESALEALERLLNQVKSRRQQLAADSAA
jgi:tetratricopeptide (TPR) repeat protein